MSKRTRKLRRAAGRWTCIRIFFAEGKPATSARPLLLPTARVPKHTLLREVAEAGFVSQRWYIVKRRNVTPKRIEVWQARSRTTVQVRFTTSSEEAAVVYVQFNACQPDDVVFVS